MLDHFSNILDHQYIRQEEAIHPSQTFQSLTDLLQVTKTFSGKMDPPMEVENPPFYAIRL